MEAFCRSLPKIELHAHLNGSLSCDTVEKLLDYHQRTWPGEQMPQGAQTLIQKGKKGSFDDPFQMFSLVHRITDNPWAVAEATKDVIKDFADDGVVYLELRTTPRRVEGRMSKEEYCQAVLNQIINSKVTSPDISVKLLLAVDRRLMQDFEEHVMLYKNLREVYPGVVVGLDISGDPRQGEIVPIIPRLKSLREEGVRVSIHLAEVANPQETAAFLEYVPDRIGHGTCIHPRLGGTEELWSMLVRCGSPVEVCMSSNVVCATVPSYPEHQTGLLDGKVPFILCTDDKGVFSCSLSGEYLVASEAFGWDKQKLFKVAKDAIGHIFGSNGEKEALVAIFDSWKMKRNDLL